MRRPASLSDRTYVGKNGKNKSFWFFVNNTYSHYLQSIRTHPRGKEYEAFVNELVKRRDAKNNARTPKAREKAEQAFIEYRNLSIEMNFRFILKQAGHYSLSVPKERYHDLVQECVMGWIRGLETFDPAKSRLTTHASYWILQGVRRFVYHDHVVHVPIYQYERGVRLDEAYSLDTPKALGRGVLDSYKTSDMSFADFLVDKDSPDPDENVHQMERSNMAYSLLIGLEERERDIVIRRFGMNGSGPEGETLQAIAEDYGLTRERVRQIEMKALNKIRDGVKRGTIKPTARPVFTVIQGGGE